MLNDGREDDGTASAIRAAAAPGAYGPGGQRGGSRAWRRESATCGNTACSGYPPIEASLQGTTNPVGGVPSTVSITSRGEQAASIATIAVTAETSASGAEPTRRRRSMPASIAVSEMSSACKVPAN